MGPSDCTQHYTNQAETAHISEFLKDALIEIRIHLEYTFTPVRVPLDRPNTPHRAGGSPIDIAPSHAMPEAAPMLLLQAPYIFETAP